MSVALISTDETRQKTQKFIERARNRSTQRDALKKKKLPHKLDEEQCSQSLRNVATTELLSSEEYSPAGSLTTFDW